MDILFVFDNNKLPGPASVVSGFILGCVCVLHVAEREKHSAAEVTYKKIPLITIM